MESDFDDFSKAGTKGKQIDSKLENHFAEWIIEHYHELGCKFIITNDFKIFRLEDFGNAFKVEANYRIKKSGSARVVPTTWKRIKPLLMKEYGLSMNDFSDETFSVKHHDNLVNQKFHFDTEEYIFSPKDYGLEIRKLSNTLNANVIFTAELKEGCNNFELSDKEFIDCLKE